MFVAIAPVAAMCAVIVAPVHADSPPSCPYPLYVEGWSTDGKQFAFAGALDPRHTSFDDDGGVVGIV